MKYLYTRKQIAEMWQPQIDFEVSSKVMDDLLATKPEKETITDNGSSQSGVAPTPKVRPDYFGKCKTCNETLKPSNERDCEKCIKWTGSFTPTTPPVSEGCNGQPKNHTVLSSTGKCVECGKDFNQPIEPVSEDKTVEGNIEPPKNVKYLNSDLKRWVKQVTDRLNILSNKEEK